MEADGYRVPNGNPRVTEKYPDIESWNILYNPYLFIIHVFLGSA